MLRACHAPMPTCARADGPTCPRDCILASPRQAEWAAEVNEVLGLCDKYRRGLSQGKAAGKKRTAATASDASVEAAHTSGAVPMDKATLERGTPQRRVE